VILRGLIDARDEEKVSAEEELADSFKTEFFV
jgi:hypothetical protein